jgi:Ca-activated chloride channel family protein
MTTTTKESVSSRRPLALLLVWSAALALVACGKSEPEPAAAAKAPAAPAAEAAVFSVLATTDLKDAQALEQMVEKATGVKLRFSWGGTMESTEAVLTGKAQADAAWFANAKYLLSDPQGQARVKLQEKIMLSPITVGVSESAAKKLGWDDPATAGKVTWKTIAKAAAEGKLSYALSNPATSNQGFMALMGVVAAASDKADALAAADVDRGAIASFLKGYKLVGDNSTYLAEKFIEGQGPRLNAFINYESWLLTLNNGGKLKEKLVLVYPKEGVSTADYPFMLLQESRRADYLKVVAYLKGGEAQTWLARQTLRRPISAEVAGQVADLFPKAGGTLVELAFSPDRQLSDGLIDAYLNEFRRPIASTFVIDTSGSMEGHGRRAQLVQAIHYISGDDSSLTGRLAKLTDRERVWMLPFSDRPRQMTYFELPAGRTKARGVQVQEDSEAKQKVLGDVRDYADRLSMSGGTALYDSVLVALEHMLAERKKNPGYQYSVVAFTDGENNQGRNLKAFQEAYAQLPEDVRAIPVFMVLFGEAKEADLKAMVQITGGKVFDARKTPLYAVFKDIRAYQ